MHHPFLVGERIYLRGLEDEDLLGPYFQWLNDQESDKFTAHAIWPNSMRKMRAFIDRVGDSRTELVLAIVENKNDRHVGNIGLHDINWVHRCATMSILIGERDARGKGYGREAIGLLVQHAFQKMNLHRIQLGVRSDNEAAIRSYRAAGFKEEGFFRQALYSAGKYYDVVRMSCLSNDRGP